MGNISDLHIHTYIQGPDGPQRRSEVVPSDKAREYKGPEDVRKSLVVVNDQDMFIYGADPSASMAYNNYSVHIDGGALKVYGSKGQLVEVYGPRGWQQMQPIRDVQELKD